MKRGDQAKVIQVYGGWIGVDHDGWTGWVYWSDLGVVERNFEWVK